ncbi:hypothetical protein BDD12DRAFT_890992 [Trichophaea hybrida]|nr:hypothetical protein BDD12DRAFT_890992 [Trichophaea hybrida]
MPPRNFRPAYEGFITALIGTTNSARRWLPRAQKLFMQLQSTIQHLPNAEPFQHLAPIYTEINLIFSTIGKLKSEETKLHRTLTLLTLEGAFADYTKFLPEEEDPTKRLTEQEKKDREKRKYWAKELQGTLEWIVKELEALAEAVEKLEVMIGKCGKLLTDVEHGVVVLGERSEGRWQWIEKAMGSGGRMLDTL